MEWKVWEKEDQDFGVDGYGDDFNDGVCAPLNKIILLSLELCCLMYFCIQMLHAIVETYFHRGRIFRRFL